VAYVAPTTTGTYSVTSTVNWCSKTVEKFGLFATAATWFPFEPKEIPRGGLNEVFSPASGFRDLYLTVCPPVIVRSGAMAFADKNPDNARIIITRPDDFGLEPSEFTTRCFDADTLNIWKEIARGIRSNTKTGVIVTNPKSGASGPSRTLRYSEGVAELARQGLPLVNFRGGSAVTIPEGASWK